MVFFDSNALSLLSIVSVGLLRGLFYYEKMVLYFLKFLKIFPDCMLHYIMKTTATMCLYIYIFFTTFQSGLTSAEKTSEPEESRKLQVWYIYALRSVTSEKNKDKY